MKSDSDSDDLYEAPVSKFNDPSIALEVAATVAQYSQFRGRGRGRGGKMKATVRGRGRGKAALVQPTSSLGLSEALVLAMNYQTSQTPNTHSQRKSPRTNARQQQVVSTPIVIDSAPSTPVPPQNVIATVDLSGGPSPPGTPIPIFQSKTVEVEDDSDSDHNDSYDPDKVRLKIKFKGSIEVHNFRKHQKFSDLMKKLAKRENCKMDQVFFERNGKIIYADSSPHSINYRISDFISNYLTFLRITFEFANNFFPFSAARVVEGLNPISQSSTDTDKKLTSFKFQSEQWKKPLILKVSKTDSFQTIIEKLAEEIKHDPKKIKLSFDGDILDMDSTPNGEGLDGGEIFDCKLL